MLSGVFNVLKPPGMTSHDVVQYLRGITSEKKVGHAGTLDPEAAGVLPVFTGAATRLLEYVLMADKCYRARMLLGVKTDTGDDSGNITERRPPPDISADELRQATEKLTGVIRQVPPMYSALKSEGKKLYQLARAGRTVERQARTITINYIKLIKMTKNEILLEIDCGKGTYIRTLLEDLAAELNTCAVMTFLLRIRAGIFAIDKTNTLEEIAANPRACVLPIDCALGHLPRLALSPNQAARFCRGMKTTLEHPPDGIVSIYAPDGGFLGIGESDGQTLRARKVLK
ncbi:MAG: tRNA pseudouridine(55) synthase TruB [Acidaminococcales bacterium]|jgi:tRNA pseudouridine55 synthase|nr:tRNA pseudouridine(55) synthase TruB [Acidaminococcales bacterium]